MSKLCLAVALTLTSALAQAQAQPPAAAIAIQPSVDTAQQRQSLQTFINCLADARPAWARQTLSHPYLSDAQARSAAEALTGRDTCILSDGAEMTFRTSSMVSNLAEHFLQSALPKTDIDRLSQTLNTLPSSNASEDFALCVAARAPTPASELVLSELGSAAELSAAGKLTPAISPCVKPGEQLTIDLQALRGLMSIALYRAISADGNAAG